MIDLDTTHVDPAQLDRTVVYVATGSGLTVMRLSDGSVEELARVQCGAVADIAVAGRLALATHKDVLVTDVCDGTLAPTGFGPANAVTLADAGLLAGGLDGRVARYDDGDWTTLDTVGEVRAVDRNLVGARDGVYRIVDGLSSAGLDDVRDVSATGRPLVATGDALYYLGPGWASALDGPFSAVDTDGDRAYAATDGTLYERIGGEWEETAVSVPTAVTGIDCTEQGYAISADGDLFTRTDDGWRTRALGVDEVTALVVGQQ